MSRVVFILIGLLLSVTASLKLWMLLTDPFVDLKTGFPIPVFWLAFIAESTTVLILVAKNIPETTKAFVCISLFAAFALASGFRALTGHATCGCFGGAAVSPIVSFGISVSVIVSLWVFVLTRTQPWQVNGKNATYWSRCVSLLGCMWVETSDWLMEIPPSRLGYLCAVVVCSLAFCVSRSEQVQSGILILAGRQSVVAHQSNVSETSDHGAIAKVTIRNCSSLPVNIIGGGKSCSCMTLTEVTGTIPPKGQVDFSVVATNKAKNGQSYRVVYYLDAPWQRVLPVNLSFQTGEF